MKTAPIKLIAMSLLMLSSLMGSSVAYALSGLPDFTSLVKQNHKAVVNISTEQSVDANNDFPGLGDPDIDKRIQEYENNPRAPRSPFEGSGLGSGFIISNDGFVLTNNHVVEGADTVIVRLHDRRELRAKVVGTDPRSDVAVLKVDATDLPTVIIGNSDELEVGEWVLAIGSPFGFDFSVTAGIVSATGRALPNESYVPFIQTDVAINPGNSGGPLFNLKGEVIGINSQIYSRTGSFMGLSFAIPIELAMDVSNQLKSVGKVSRGWLGVHIQEVTMDLAESFGMTTAHGAVVSSILDDSPASRSSLQVGDVITHFDGKKVDKSSSLPPLVGRVPVNTDARLRVVRQGKPIEVIVNIGELPGQEELARAVTPRRGMQPNALKLNVETLDDATRSQYGIDKGGVIVSRVISDGPADAAGIEPGDILLMVDNKPVDSPAQFESVVEQLGSNKSVAVLVQRESGPVFLALQMEK